MKARRTNEINEGMAHILCCHKKGEPQGVMESGSHTRRLDQANCRMGLPLFVFAHRLPILRRDPAFSAEGLNGNVRLASRTLPMKSASAKRASIIISRPKMRLPSQC